MKRLLIVGAGASNDFDPEMGTGYNLIDHIAKRVIDENSEEKYLSTILETIGYNYDFRKSFSNKIIEFLNSDLILGYSIDSFLDKNPEYYDIGRFCIAFHIIGYEAASIRRNINVFFSKESWLKNLKNKLMPDSIDENLKIITFNYDRLIEYYLYHYFENDIIDFSKNNIIHIYGKLADLQWQNKFEYCNYGHPNNDIRRIKGIMNNFHLMFGERNAINNSAIDTFINEAKQIIFLGFGYDEYNLNKLGIKRYLENREICGTFYGCNIESKNRVSAYFDDKISLKTKTCSEFISEIV